MELTPDTIISLVGLATTAVVGIILSKQIASQKDTINHLKTIIDSMKSLNDIYNFDKLRSYTEILKISS